MSKQIRLDIVGCGAVVQNIHGKFLRKLVSEHQLKIHGCYDQNIENAKKVGHYLRSERVGGPSEIQDLDQIDGVIVATPPESHYGYTVHYLMSNVSVFVEKPFVTDINQANEIMSLARQKGKRVLVGHVRRYYPAVRKAKLYLADRIDRVVKVVASEGFVWDWPARSRYFLEERFGGIVYDTGSHLVDMVLFVLGLEDHTDLTYEVSVIRKVPEEEPSHDFACRIDFFGGINFPLYVYLSRIQPFANAVKVYLDYGDVLILPTKFSNNPIISRKGKVFALESISIEENTSNPNQCFMREIEEFLQILQNSSSRSLIDGSSFLLLVRLLKSMIKGSDE